MQTDNTNIPTPEACRANVASFESKSAVAFDWLAQCEQDYADTLLAHSEGRADSAAVAKARKTLAEAKQTSIDAVTGLQAAKQRLEQVDIACRANETALRWDRVRQLAADRIKVAAEVEKLAEVLADAVGRLIQANDGIAAVCPVAVEPAGSLTGQAYIHGVLRECMARCRANPWEPMPLSQWELLRRPRLTESIEAANEYLLKGAMNG